MGLPKRSEWLQPHNDNNYPTKEIEMIIDKLKLLTGKWSIAYDNKDVTLTINGSQNVFHSFSEAETFVEHQLDKEHKWPGQPLISSAR